MTLRIDDFSIPASPVVIGTPETGRPEAPNGALLVDIVRVNGTSGPDTDWVAQEIPVALVYNGISHAVMMTTPRDLEAFAVGFSLAEGIVKSTDEIYGIEVEDTCRGKAVKLEVASSAFWAPKSRRRSMAGRTGCGLCGVESLGDAVRTPSVVPQTQTFSIRHLDQALAYLNDAEELGRLTGCTHAAVWVNPDGTLAGGALKTWAATSRWISSWASARPERLEGRRSRFVVPRLLRNGLEGRRLRRRGDLRGVGADGVGRRHGPSGRRDARGLLPPRARQHLRAPRNASRTSSPATEGLYDILPTVIGRIRTLLSADFA